MDAQVTLLAPADAPDAAAAKPAADTPPFVADAARTAALQLRLVEAVSQVFDPEIPVNVYELGLIYDMLADASGVVLVRMTLTAPACPSAETLPAEVRRRVAEVDGVSEVKLELVWDPPWDRDRMSEAAKLQLGLD